MPLSSGGTCDVAPPVLLCEFVPRVGLSFGGTMTMDWIGLDDVARVLSAAIPGALDAVCEYLIVISKLTEKHKKTVKLNYETLSIYSCQEYTHTRRQISCMYA